MAVVNFNYPKFKYTIASTGQPGAGYKLFTYEEGTSTKKTTWTSLAKTAQNTNPIILDANGEADVWIDGRYKFVLALPTDTDPPTSPVWTYDAVRSSDEATSSATRVMPPLNGSFEDDVDSDGVPDNWTVATLSGGTITIDSTTSTHGTDSLKFESSGAGGGSASTNEYYEVEAGKDIRVHFSVISADVDTHNKLEFYWYNSSKVFISATAAWDEAAANSTSWVRRRRSATAPATAKFVRIVITGVAADSVTHSSTNFDNIELDTGFMGEVTATANQLNILDGATVTTAELNILDGVTATAAELNTLDGITATVTELNYTDGVTSNIQTQLDDLDTAKADATTDAILALVAAGAVGAVGTYAFLGETTSGENVAGNTVAGSALRYAGVEATDSWNASAPPGISAVGGTTAPAGTWRCMGRTGITYGATLWLRIS